MSLLWDPLYSRTAHLACAENSKSQQCHCRSMDDRHLRSNQSSLGLAGRSRAGDAAIRLPQRPAPVAGAAVAAGMPSLSGSLRGVVGRAPELASRGGLLLCHELSAARYDSKRSSGQMSRRTNRGSRSGVLSWCTSPTLTRTSSMPRHAASSSSSSTLPEPSAFATKTSLPATSIG